MSAAAHILRARRGSAYVEFIFAFIPLFMFFLSMVQLALLYTAGLVVQHAANRAVRSAVVVLPDDPARYSGQTVNSLRNTSAGSSAIASIGGGVGEGIGGAFGSAVGSAAEDLMPRALGMLGVGYSGGLHMPMGGGNRVGGARMRTIRTAASMPLLAISPSFEQMTGDPSIYAAIGGSPGERAANGGVLYNRFAVAVTFPTAPGSNRFRETFGSNDPVTVRVTYLFHCAVPVAREILCNDYASFRTGGAMDRVRDLAGGAVGGGSSGETSSLVDRVRTTAGETSYSDPGLAELAYAESDWLGFLTTASGARFYVVRAEATLRNQGAHYAYVSGNSSMLRSAAGSAAGAVTGGIGF